MPYIYRSINSDPGSKVPMSTIGIPINANGSFYLARNKGGITAGKLCPYGGKNKENETNRNCMIREFQEESGATTDFASIEATATLKFFIEEKPIYISRVYLIRDWSGPLLETREKEAPILFRMHDSFDYSEMMPGDHYWLRLVLSNITFTGIVIYNKKMSEATFSMWDGLA